MNEITAIVLGGMAWDGIKMGAKFTGEKMRELLRGWLLEPKDYETIAQEVNKIPQQYKETELFVKAYLDNNSSIKEILSHAKPDQQIVIINQTHSGSGDSVGRDKNVRG